MVDCNQQIVMHCLLYILFLGGINDKLNKLKIGIFV